jgi:hypothetical protein
MAEREVELTAVYGLYGGPFNCAGRHTVWDGVDVDHVLVQHGYGVHRPPRGHPMRPQYLLKSLPVRRRMMRSTDIVLRPVLPKTESFLLTGASRPEEGEGCDTPSRAPLSVSLRPSLCVAAATA